MMELWPFTNFHDLNLDWIIRVIKEWNKKLDEFFNGNGFHDMVDRVLGEHPEWTTTVQNGSITEPKIESTFLAQIKNDYVTPQMYGAKGDGVTDDTNAFNLAFNDGKPVYVPAGTYIATDTIRVENGVEVCFDRNAKLRLESPAVIDCFLDISNNYQIHDRNTVICGTGDIDGNDRCLTVVGLHGYRTLTWDGPNVYNGIKVLMDMLYNRDLYGYDAAEAVVKNVLLKNSTYHA